MTIIWHNPRCSKSRQTLQLLRDRDIEPEVIEYLKHPPSEKEIADVLEMLNIEPRALMRTSENEYRLGNLASVSDAQKLIDAMVECPVLIERPIVIHNGKAVIGRPPQNVLALL